PGLHLFLGYGLPNLPADNLLRRLVEELYELACHLHLSESFLAEQNRPVLLADGYGRCFLCVRSTALDLLEGTEVNLACRFFDCHKLFLTREINLDWAQDEPFLFSCTVTSFISVDNGHHRGGKSNC